LHAPPKTGLLFAMPVLLIWPLCAAVRTMLASKSTTRAIVFFDIVLPLVCELHLIETQPPAHQCKQLRFKVVIAQRG
jgi:hypothetical protein